MIRKYIFTLVASSFLVLLMVAPQNLFSQDPDREESEPSAAARVSVINGDVASMRGDSGDWVATVVNTPLVTGDAISTGDNSRTEVQLDYAHVLRLADRTQVKIANLAASQVQVQVSQGLVDFVTLRPSDSDVEIDTPNVAVRPLAEGGLRIGVNSEAETVVIVRRGEANVSASDGSSNLETDQQMTVQGTGNQGHVESPGHERCSSPQHTASTAAFAGSVFEVHVNQEGNRDQKPRQGNQSGRSRERRGSHSVRQGEVQSQQISGVPHEKRGHEGEQEPLQPSEPPLSQNQHHEKQVRQCAEAVDDELAACEKCELERGIHDPASIFNANYERWRVNYEV
jgi:hypothetical protein